MVLFETAELFISRNTSVQFASFTSIEYLGDESGGTIGESFVQPVARRSKMKRKLKYIGDGSEFATQESKFADDLNTPSPLI